MTVDLSLLPPPDVIRELDVATIKAEMLAHLATLLPELAPSLALESEPMVKLTETVAYFLMLYLQRGNEIARAAMLATARGADLEHLGALFGVTRLVISPADPAALPPLDAVMEPDTELRARIQLSIEGFSVGGPRGAYKFHAMSADGQVKDVAVSSPSPGEVQVAVLSREGNGAAPAALRAKVSAALNAEEVRPLCDSVLVVSAGIVNYAVVATVKVAAGPDATVIKTKAEVALAAYVSSAHRIGSSVRLSGIYAALHQPGVSGVVLASPNADVLVSASEAPWCTSVSVTLEVEA